MNRMLRVPGQQKFQPIYALVHLFLRQVCLPLVAFFSESHGDASQKDTERLRNRNSKNETMNVTNTTPAENTDTRPCTAERWKLHKSKRNPRAAAPVPSSVGTEQRPASSVTPQNSSKIPTSCARTHRKDPK